MIRHYLASALAKFRKAPFTTGANVLTLALGLAAFIAAYGIVTYWRSADSHHPGADRLLFISESINAAGATSPRTMNQIASPTIARYLAAFSQRIDLTLAPFVTSLGVTLAIACIVVIGEVLKAASIHPAEALRRA